MRGAVQSNRIIDNLNKYDWNFPDSNCSEDIHGIHPYPAKFIPEIPRTLIKEIGVPKNSVIFDPFCGSGTTLVEAQSAGIQSVGVDLNPIACLISKVKTTSLPSSFVGIATVISNKARHMPTQPAPVIPNLNHWFKKDIQKALCALMAQIEAVEEESIVNALKLALSSIIVRVSKQESDTRYAAIEKKMTASDVYKLFEGSCKKIANNVPDENKAKIVAKVITKDILKVAPDEIGNNVGLVITSPPYPNAYEYWLYHKYRMWWLGYNPEEVKKQEIGARAHYFKKNHHTADNFIENMKSTFSLLSSVMKKRSYACFVIGSSIIHGKEIDNAQILNDVARDSNFKLSHQFSRVISANRKSFNLAHARIKKEDILLFQK